MIQRIRYIVNAGDDSVMGEFMDRLLFSGIQTEEINSSGNYICYQSVWNNSILSEPVKQKNPRNAGAKLKVLNHNGKPVSCGAVFLLKSQKHLSDSAIGELLNASGSTISRRIKRHMENGNFYNNSKTIF